MKKILILAALFASLGMRADIKNVTSQYVTNPDFGARYAGWFNQAGSKGVAGGFLHKTDDNFSGKRGEVYMEKWVSQGNSIPNCNMYQYLKNLPSGTYTLVCAAFCGTGSGTYSTSSGGYLYAQNEQTAINGDAGDYSVIFTVGDDGKAVIGIKSQNAACNWMAFDNMRLYYNTEINSDSLSMRQSIINTERQKRQSIQDAERSAAVVTTYPYVAAGITIALMRASYTTNGTTISESGVCWSSESKEPTIMDECSTEYFYNKGNIFRMEGLSPATGYWARPYVITNDGKVSYGETMKFYTERKGRTSYAYDYKAQEESASLKACDYNINSGMAETVWMYNQLAYLTDLYLNVHYVRGAGAGSGTADCSYGGWMRVSQSTAYQQTGTMLHETNHGVGVGTTSEWYNNSNLRSNTSSGKWLGPRATQMIRFLENNEEAYMQGDGTHMWGGTTSGSLTYGYGINGAQEDSYNPSNQLLYFGNILITHALHQDGLLATWSSGITASYTFIQDDDEVYYLKAENSKYGFNDRYIGNKTSGMGKSFGNVKTELTDIADDPNFQWKVTFDPNRAMYAFKNVATGEYLNASSSPVKVSGTTPTDDNYFMLLPARSNISSGNFTATSYWMVRGNWYDSNAVKAILPSQEVSSLTVSTYDASNDGGTAQRFLILKRSEAVAAQTAARDIRMSRLNEIISGCDALVDIPVTESENSATATFEQTLNKIKKEKTSYTTATEVDNAVSALLSSVTEYLTSCRPCDPRQPMDLSFMWQNMSMKDDTESWTTTTTPTVGNGCYEFYEKTYDIYQISESQLPTGNYRVTAQAFQRPGKSSDTYEDYITNGTDNTNAKLYVVNNGRTTSTKVANIWRDCTTSSLGTGSTSVNGKHIPNNLESAAAWFDNDKYKDTLEVTTTSIGTMRLGLSGTTGTSYWTAFRGGLQVLFYGDMKHEDIEDLPESENYNIGSLRYGRFQISGTDVHEETFSQKFETRKTPNTVLSAPTSKNKVGKFINLRSVAVNKISTVMTAFVDAEGNTGNMPAKESVCYLALPKDSTCYDLPSVYDKTQKLTLQCGTASNKVGKDAVHVSFTKPYAEGVIPVVIVTPVKTSSISYGMAARVENVSNTGFDVRIFRQEYYSDKAFTAVNVYYFAMEPGEASLGGGLLISAQRFEDALLPDNISGKYITLDTPLLNPYTLFGAQSIKHDVLREVFMGKTGMATESDGQRYTTSIAPYAYLDETANTDGTAYTPTEDLGIIAVATDPNGSTEDEPTVTIIRSIPDSNDAEVNAFDVWTEGNMIRSNNSNVRVYSISGIELGLNKPLPTGLYIVTDSKYSKKINIR